MVFKRNDFSERLGQAAGYIFSYIMFTTILYFVLFSSRKLPANWTYFHVALLSFCVSLAGETIKRLIK